MGFTTPTTPESFRQVEIVETVTVKAATLIQGVVPFVRDWVAQRIRLYGWSANPRSSERMILRHLFYMRFCEVLAHPELLMNPMLIQYKVEIEKLLQGYNTLTNLTKRYYVWPPEGSFMDLTWDLATKVMKYPSELLLLKSAWLLSEQVIDDYLRPYFTGTPELDVTRTPPLPLALSPLGPAQPPAFPFPPSTQATMSPPPDEERQSL
jgi:hypothetical protein